MTKITQTTDIQSDPPLRQSPPPVDYWFVTYQNNSDHPLLRYEEILGDMLIFKLQHYPCTRGMWFHPADIKSLGNYRRQITRHICKHCVSWNTSACSSCRVLAIKAAYTRILAHG